MSKNIELAEHYLELGVEAKRVGQYNKAIQFYKKAEELNPEDGIIYYSMAKTYYILENYAEAIDNYIKYTLTGVISGRFSIGNFGNDLPMHLGHALYDTHNKPHFRKMYLCSIDPFNQNNHKTGITESMWREESSYENFCASKAEEYLNTLLQKWRERR